MYIVFWAVPLLLVIEKKAVIWHLRGFQFSIFKDYEKHIAKKVNKFEKIQIKKNNIHIF